MIFLPEVKLKKLCDAFLMYVKENLLDAITQNLENESYLYLLFHEDSTDDTMSAYYTQAKEIFLREKIDRRVLETRAAFDRTRSGLPTIHIMIPQDSTSFVQLGDIEGGEYETGAKKIEKGFESQFNIICSSENLWETQIVIYVLRALFLGSGETLEYIGFVNPKFAVQDISIRPDLMPAGIYIKGLLMDATYVEIVPQFGLEKLTTNVLFILEQIKYQ